LILASDGNLWIPDNVGSSSGNGDVISLSLSDGKVLQTFGPLGTSAALVAFPISLL
jgi:hypothetical protein